MINDVLVAIFVLVALGLGVLAQPQRARCPRGEFVEGVRRDGSTWCIETPRGEIDCRGARACRSNVRLRYTRPLKIYCTGGTRPIVVDYRTVGCQR